MIRPGAVAAILRWREAGIGAVAVLVGIWVAFSNFGVTRWLGVIIAIGGAAILREGVQRLLRPRDGDGPGVVDVTERQITYMSATGGGAVSLDLLSFVALERQGAAAPVWRLADSEGNAVSIPSDAANGNAMLDALVADSRIDPGRTLAALRDPSRGSVTLLDTSPKRLG